MYDAAVTLGVRASFDELVPALLEAFDR